MSSKANADHRSTLFAGCAMSIGSALVTCFLLFLNGSLVMAVMSALAASGPSWARRPQFSQFMLFLVPVLMVVVEWLMIDYLRKRLWQRPPE